MTRCFTALCLLLWLGSPAHAQKKNFTLEQTQPGAARVSLTGNVERWSFHPSGLLQSGGRNDRKYFDPKTLEPAAAPAPDAPDEAEAPARPELEAALAAVDGVGKDLAAQLAKADWHEGKDGSRWLLRNKALYVHRDGEGAKRFFGKDEPPTEEVDVTPDGRFCVFARAHDLYALATQDGTMRRLTDNGSKDRFNGQLDWVYQEEVYGRGTFRGYFLSPDSRWMAFLSLDESAVYDFTVIDHIDAGDWRVTPEVTKYPKVGDPNPKVELMLAELATGNVRKIDLARYESSEPLVVRVDWTPDSRLLFVAQDRIQSWADLNAVDPTTLQWKTWIHEESKGWVDRPEAPRFLADGGFLWQSDRTGYRHLYRYDRDGALVRALTDGKWAVGDVVRVDEDTGTIVFEGRKDGAIDRNLYTVPLAGGAIVRLTEGEGTHRVTFSPDRTLFLDSVSSITSPPKVRLCRADGKLVKVLAEAEIKAGDEYALGEVERLEIPARDGFLLDASLVKPVGHPAGGPFPIWLPTYSGPDMPTVSNQWSGSVWHQFLAQHGFLVLQVNVRTASGKGHEIIEACHRRLGAQELADLEDAVAWVVKNRKGDAARVGITGYSYGGFMAAYALTHSDKFALGISGGGVYDWRMYDTIYTERYMGLPDDNESGYTQSSVVKSAAKLKGHLLIHHSTMDDNVHEQNAMQLVYALEKADRQFELMLYPESRHGVGDMNLSWHFRQLEWRTIERELGQPRAAAATGAGN